MRSQVTQGTVAATRPGRLSASPSVRICAGRSAPVQLLRQVCKTRVHGILLCWLGMVSVAERGVHQAPERPTRPVGGTARHARRLAPRPPQRPDPGRHRRRPLAPGARGGGVLTETVFAWPGIGQRGRRHAARLPRALSRARRPRVRLALPVALLRPRRARGQWVLVRVLEELSGRAGRDGTDGRGVAFRLVPFRRHRDGDAPRVSARATPPEMR
jgi:hypothetical protein